MGLSGFTSLPLPLTEYCRAGVLYHGGQTAVAAGIAPVADLPTTTAGAALYNNNEISGGKCLVIFQAGFWIASGTPALGAQLIGGVTPLPVLDAQRPTAHTSNWNVANLNAGKGDNSGALWKAACTVPSTVHLGLGGNLQPATAAIGVGIQHFDFPPMIVPPRYAACFGVLSGTGTSPLYMFSVKFLVLSLDLTLGSI